MITLFELLLPVDRQKVLHEIRSHLPKDVPPQTVQHLCDMAAASVHRARGAAMVAAAMKGER